VRFTTHSLTTHSRAETYSVLTILPGAARVKPADEAALLAADFDDSIAPSVEVSGNLPALRAHSGSRAVVARQRDGTS